MVSGPKRLPARFFCSETGKEPARDWLLALSADNRKTIGDDIRTDLSDGRIARMFFCAHAGSMVLLHGFVKKTQKTPPKELDIAERRMKGLN